MIVAIVIDDPELANRKEIERNVNANMLRLPEMNRTGGNKRKIEKAVRAMVGKPKMAGDLHDAVELECPDGMPNCRNCGDPEYAESCQEAGHCPDCGTLHGCAPDSTVAANGYRLVEIDEIPEKTRNWNRVTERFE